MRSEAIYLYAQADSASISKTFSSNCGTIIRCIQSRGIFMESKNIKSQKLSRAVFYFAGMTILSAGIILNTKSGYGVSPIISVAFTASQIWNINFGNASLVLYIILAVIEYRLEWHRNFKPYDLLQIPLSIILTRLFNLFGVIFPDVQSVPGRAFCLALGITLTGMGAAMNLNARLVPNPGDGIVQAISDCSGKSMGLCKNCTDFVCVALAASMGLIFTGHLTGLGIGTVFAMIGVGRAMALYNWLFQKLELRLVGLAEA